MVQGFLRVWGMVIHHHRTLYQGQAGQRLSEKVRWVILGERRWVTSRKRRRDRSKAGHLTRINQQFARAREKAGLPKDLVMYCARHDFGTYALSRTGNLAAVMKTMGHKDVKTATQYQHPEL